MAFVGFKTTADAVKALEYFHNTFIDTSRVQVEYARAVKSAQLPRPWSKHSSGSSAHRRANETPEERTARELKAADTERFIGVRELKKMKRAKKDAYEKEIDDLIAADPKLSEFMRLTAPRHQQRLWDNQAADVEAERAAGGELGLGEVVNDVPGTRDEPSDEDEAPPEFDDDGSDDDDQYQDIDGSDSDDEDKTHHAGGKQKKGKTKTQKTKAKPVRRRTGREMSDDSESDSESQSKSDADDDELDDLDYLKRKSAKNFSDSDSDSESEDEDEDEDKKEEEEDDSEVDSDMEGIDDLEDDPGASDDEDDDEEEEEDEGDEEDADEKSKLETPDAADKANDDKPKVHEVTAEDMEAVAETGRLFIRNLPFTATEEEVAAHFAPYGNLTGVFILADKATKRSKGLAYITYALPENASKAMEELDGSIFQGRLIHLLPAKRPPRAEDILGGAAAAEDEEAGGFKKSREDRLKRDAGTNRAAWNSLFMRQDTVAAAIAAKYGVTKADLLESGENDVAVRMALGEAQVIADTKDQLSQAGVDPTALETAAASSGANANKTGIRRSNVAILLKNLPYESEVGELRGLCERFGAVARMVSLF